MAEKQQYDIKIWWKSGRHEWKAKKKTRVLAESMTKALEDAIKEEERPWRWDIQGKAKPSEQFCAFW